MDQPLSSSRRITQPPPADDVQLRPSRVLALRAGGEQELVDALAELLLAWLEPNPERLRAGGGPSEASAVVSGFSCQEEA